MTTDFSQLTCPDPITWTNDIAKLFTAADVDHMKKVTKHQKPALDLSSYASVKIWASKIFSEVSTGAMPPADSGEDPWTPAMVTTFGCWIRQGCQQ